MEFLGLVKAAEEIHFKTEENSVLKERITMEMFCRCCNIGRERDIRFGKWLHGELRESTGEAVIKGENSARVGGRSSIFISFLPLGSSE